MRFRPLLRLIPFRVLSNTSEPPPTDGRAVFEPRRKGLVFGLSLTLLALGAGCGGSVQVKSSTEGDAATDTQADAPAGQPQGPQGRGIGKVVRTGQPQVTYPGFEVLPDGKSVVTVQVSGPTEVSEQKSEGRLVYFLKGVAVPEKVNRLPLVSTNFASQVARVQVDQTQGGANIILELREAAVPTHTVTPIEGGTLLTITLPKSQKFGADGLPKSNDKAKTVDADTDTEDDAAQGDGGHQHRRGHKSDSDYEREADEADRKAQGVDEEKVEHDRRYKRAIRMPVPYVRRHITLSYRTLAPDVGISLRGFGSNNPNVYLMSGIHIGIVDTFEIEITPNAFRLASKGGYFEPSFGATWNFLQTQPFDMAVRARFFIPVDTGATDRSGLAKPKSILEAGIPMIFHLGSVAKIDTGVTITSEFSSPSRVGLVEQTASPYFQEPGIPVKFVFQPVDALFLGVGSGLTILDFKHAKENTFIPLGFQVGVTTESKKKPAADFGVKFDWPEFGAPNGAVDAANPDGKKVVVKDYQLAAWLRWYYYL